MKFVKKFNKYKYYILAVLLVLVVALFLFINNYDKNEPGLGEEFEISIGENVSIKETDLKISMLRISDSRCPLNTNCILQGQASVTFNFFRNDILLRKSVLSYNGENAELFVNGYRVYVLGVIPYPEQGRSIEDSEYIVKMVVFKD